MRSTKYVLGFSLMIGVFLGSCNKWDDHMAIREEALNENLMEQISKHSDLGKFRDYLVKTGLDKELSASKNFTVWAPSDAALADLSPDIVNDVEKLKTFLENHIAGQLFFTRMAADSVRIAMLNDKRVYAFQHKFDDANITAADIYVKNGVLHIIDKAVAPLPSLWEFISNTGDEYDQNKYISSLAYEIQDPNLAELDSINPNTGLPVYKPGTGMVTLNAFQTKVYDVANEDSLYTYILLNNAGFGTAVEEQKPYFKSTITTITDRNAAWNIAKDMAVKGFYAPDRLPAALVSRFNVHIGINKSKITKTIKLSNGIAYVISEAPAPKEEKIPVYRIEGETPASFSSYEDKYISKIFRRNRITPDGVPFQDIYLNLGSGGVNYYVDYYANGLYTLTYKVYWVALNDKTISGQGDDPYGTDSTLTQSLSVGNYSTDPVVFDFKVESSVEPDTYTEVYLGEYTTSENYDWSLETDFTDGRAITPATRLIRLSAPTASKSGIPNNLTLDYIKFVPVFN